MVPVNDLHDQVLLIVADIEAVEESISLTRAMLDSMPMSGKDRRVAEQLIASNQAKINRWQETVSRYRKDCARIPLH